MPDNIGFCIIRNKYSDIKQIAHIHGALLVGVQAPAAAARVQARRQPCRRHDAEI